jgi:predicted transcriptional regulator
MVEEHNASPGTNGSGSELQAHFGKTVREARHKAGLTQTHLAELSGLAQQYIARIEAGHINPTLATMVAVARVLHLNVGDMLSQAGPPTE